MRNTYKAFLHKCTNHVLRTIKSCPIHGLVSTQLTHYLSFLVVYTNAHWPEQISRIEEPILNSTRERRKQICFRAKVNPSLGRIGFDQARVMWVRQAVIYWRTSDGCFDMPTYDAES